MAHPFAGRAGSKLRDSFATRLFVEQDGKCRMCATPINATLRGTRDSRSAVVDHIRPWRLRPDLAKDITGCQLICRACHAKCDSIEKRHWPDADRIAAEKARQRAFGVDGWPVA